MDIYNNAAVEAYSLKLITGPTVWVATPADIHANSQRPVQDSDEDDLITEWIKAATELIEQLANRILLSQTWEYRLGRFPGVDCRNYGNGILLPKGPWQSITSVKYYAADGTDTTIASSEYLFDDASGWLTPVYAGTWPTARYRTQAVRIRYLSGYGAAATSVPFVLKNAVVMTVQDWLENRHGRFEVPAGVKEKLDAYWPGTMI